MATTVISRLDEVFGRQRAVIAKLTTSTASDTYNTGLAVVTGWSADGGSAAVTGVTFSGGTATITSSAGVTGLSLVVYGY